MVVLKVAGDHGVWLRTLAAAKGLLRCSILAILLAGLSAEERTVFTFTTLPEAAERFALPLAAGWQPLSTVLSPDLRFAAAVDNSAAELSIGLLSEAPRKVALPANLQYRVAGFVANQAAIAISGGMASGGEARTLAGLIMGTDADAALPLNWPQLADPNVSIRSRGLVLDPALDQPGVIAWVLAGRSGFSGQETLLMLARFSFGGELMDHAEVVLNPRDDLIRGYQQHGANLAWMNVARRRLLFAGATALTEYSEQGRIRSNWSSPLLALPMQPNGLFTTLVQDEAQEEQLRQYGAMLTNGRIIGAFASTRTVMVRRWRVDPSLDLPTEPEISLASELPSWFVENRQQRRVLDAGEDILVIGAAILHQGVPNELLGFVDLRRERPAFVPLLADNNIITLYPQAKALVRRGEGERFDLWLSLQGQQLLLPCNAEGLIQAKSD